MSLLKSLRDDPGGVVLALAIAALVVSGAALYMEQRRRSEIAGWLRMYRFQNVWPYLNPPPLPERDVYRPEPLWRDQVGVFNVLRVPGHHVRYWGRPDRKYGVRVTLEQQWPRAVVIHYTTPKPLLNFVRYQHSGDKRRGGAFGYHFYIGADGSIIQGAPLDRRTNHIKDSGHGARTKVAAWASGRNAIGVAAVGACRVVGRSMASARCSGWDTTAKQGRALRAAVRAVQKRFDIPCKNVFGHGELQIDRRGYEGSLVASQMRDAC